MKKQEKSTSKKKTVTHGLVNPVIISVGSDLVEQFCRALKELKNDRSKGFQSFFNIKQNNDNIILTSYFHDSEMDFKLELEAKRREKK